MKFYCVTDKGMVRELNEDYYYLPSKGEHFAAVADGMGGHAAGEVASRLAVSALAESLRSFGEDLSKENLNAAFACANAAVHKEAGRDNAKQGMGTTLTAIWFNTKNVFLGHVGDSRAYRLRDGVLEQMSTDHSFVEELVRSGAITREQARVHPKRNIITRCIGVYNEVEVDLMKLERRDKDIWFLCSDGLINYVTDEEIETELKSDKPWEIKINALKKLALKRGGADNITILAAVGGKA